MNIISRVLSLVLILTAISISPSVAQSNRAALNAQNNSTFYSCGTGCITGSTLNTYHGLQLNSFGVLSDSNTWTGQNTFTGVNSFTNSVIFSIAPQGIVLAPASIGDLTILNTLSGQLIDAAYATPVFWNSNQNLEAAGFLYYDNVPAATQAPGQQFSPLVIQDYVLSGATGNHASITGFLDVQQTPTTTGPYNFVGVWGFSFCNANLGGTNVSGSGECFGVNPQAQVTSTATYWNEVAGVETDVEADTGSAVLSKIGENITTIGSDAVQGSITDAAILLGSVTGSPGWKNGLALSNFNGAFPIASSGSVINVLTAGTVAYGINFSNLTCTTACFVSTGFSVDGSGNAKVKSLSLTNTVASSTAPTFTSGACTGSIGTVNGTAAFTFATGSGTCGSTATIGLPAAATGWICDALDLAAAGTSRIQQTSSTTNSIVLTNYSIGAAPAAANFTASHTVRVTCSAY